jgi:hypothetical protein
MGTHGTAVLSQASLLIEIERDILDMINTFIHEVCRQARDNFSSKEQTAGIVRMSWILSTLKMKATRSFDRSALKTTHKMLRHIRWHFFIVIAVRTSKPPN